MASVKLVNNPNRSMNPFKGQFLLNFKVKLRNDNTKGKIVSEGNYVFKHYQELIEIEDYLIGYLNDRVDQKDLDKGILKWPLDEDLQKAFLYYKTFFLRKEDDDKLEDLWLDLKVVINKVDDFIEKESNKIWNEYLENGKSVVLYNKAYDLIKQLINQPYFKTSVKLLSAWIQLICDAKGVEYEVSQKISPTGVKFDVFIEKEKPKEILVAQAENIQEIKKKYTQYEKAKLKSDLSAMGAYTDLKFEGGDALEFYYEEEPKVFDKEKFIKLRKEKVLENHISVLSGGEDPLFLRVYKENREEFLKLKNASDLEKYREEKILDDLKGDQPAFKQYLNGIEGSDEMVGYFYNLITNKIKPNLAFVFEQFLINKKLVPTGMSFKPLITKLKQSKVDSDEKLFLIVSQFLNALGLDLNSNPADRILEEIQKFKISTYLSMSDLIQIRVNQTGHTKEKYENAYLPIVQQFASLEELGFVYDGTSINLEIEKQNKANNKKIKALHSDSLGVIYSENGKSAYEVYQEKKSEIDLKIKVLKNSFPIIEGNTLIFRNMKRTPVYQRDIDGNVIMQNGVPLMDYERTSKGVIKLDKRNIPIPKYETSDVTSEIKVERLPDVAVDSLPGLEREVELSDDTTIKPTSPFKFAHIVKVKTTTIDGITKDIITKGPFKGFSVEDLANATGKFLGDGSSYSVDANGNIVSVYETTISEDGDVRLNYETLEEPYITWARGRFLIGLPNDNKHSNEREALKDLQKTRATMEAVAGSTQRRWSFYFEGDDYEAIKDCLGSCLMSKKAQEELKKYYKRILQKDLALKEENVAKYTATAIGGYKAGIKLNNKQKEALAWLDSNGMKGVMSLDTGVGKTLTGISAIHLASKTNPSAKFLIVSPDRLVGNFIGSKNDKGEFVGGEISKFLDESVAKNLTKRCKEISYTEFVKMYQEDFNFKKEFYCLVFDEVNEALTGKKAQAISGVQHPNKILLTASSLEKSPSDLFRFVSLSSGNPVDPEKEKAFVEKYAVNIGGKFVGIKPEVRHQFTVWLKQNAYFANKMDVDYEEVGQVPLKPLSQVNTKVSMSKEVATAYKTISKGIQKELKQMQDRYAFLLSDENVSAMPENLQKEKDIAVGALKDKIALLHLFSLNPNKAMAKIKGGKVSDYNLPNPKIDEAVRLAGEFSEGAKVRRAIYFTEDNDVAKQTIVAISHRLRGKVHALCLTNYIQFYRDGKPISKSKVTKKTNVDNFVLRTANTDPSQDSDMTWAIKTVKKFIAQNNQVATMVCNSSYARGFNLQQFKAVVHLDRDGWDSEEIKQRTARAFRQGQEDEVLEVMVDAVLPHNDDGSNEMSMDELRGMVHGADQKFFNDIIKNSGSIKLSANYDSIEHASVSDKATKPSLQNFARAIAPTREVLNEAEVIEKGKKENPIKYTTLDPNRFNHPVMKNLKPEQKRIADLSGLSGITNVASEFIILEGLNVNTYSTSIKQTATIPWLEYYKRKEGDTFVENDHFKARGCAPNSLGSRALFSQVVAMKKEGKQKIINLGAGNFDSFDKETGLGNPGDYIGYYVWPKFGYNAKVFIEKADKKLKGYADMYQKALIAKTQGPDRVIADPPARPEKQKTGPVAPLTIANFRGFDQMYRGHQKEKLLSLMNSTGVGNFNYFNNALKRYSDKDINDFISFGYFKRRDIENEKNWYLANRVEVNYGKFVGVFPFSRANTKNINELKEGEGKYLSSISTEDILRDLDLFFDDRYEEKLNSWNSFIDEYLSKYKGLATLYNKIVDEERVLTIQEILNDLPMINENVATPEEIQSVENQYKNDMLIYKQQYDQYEQGLKVIEQAMENASILIEKESIMGDINNNIYPAVVESFLEDGTKWWKMRYAKSAYILLKKLGSVPPQMDILDLYAITAKEPDGSSFKAGELWWSYVGTSQNYELQIQDENSKSYKHLTKYMMSKVKEAGFETLEEYLSSPIEPFNVNSYECWLDLFNGDFIKHTASQKIEILKAYAKNLKKVLLESDDSDREVLLNEIKKFELESKVKFNVSRVAKLRKKARDEKLISSEDIMANLVKDDEALFTSIQGQLENEEVMQKTQKEIAELRGDLKPVSNPFGKSKKGTN